MKTLCVSLETAKKLKAAGWTKPTEFIYEDLGHRQQLRLGSIKMNTGDFYAPTAEEVLRELPEKIDLNEWRRDLQFIFISPEKGKWEVSYGQFKKFKNKSLSEAAALMWLWCVEQGYIKTEVK